MSHLDYRPTPGQPTRAQVATRWTAGLTALMFGLEGVDTVVGHAMDGWGIVPRDPERLPSIIVATLLHLGWGHLLANALPMMVFGFLLLLEGLRRFVQVTLIVTVVSGMTVWLLSAPGSVTLGASGVIFGWFLYLLARGVYTRSATQILVAVVILLVWGGMLWGVLPLQVGVSWQAHLGGAVGGVIAARSLAGRGTKVTGAGR